MSGIGYIEMVGLSKEVERACEDNNDDEGEMKKREGSWGIPTSLPPIFSTSNTKHCWMLRLYVFLTVDLTF